MELKHIKELMTVMGRTRTKRLQLKQNDFELILERHDTNLSDASPDSQMHYSEDQFKQFYLQNRADQALSRAAEMPSSRHPSSPEISKPDASSLFVTSPMVGTFYLSPSPDDPNFIKLGEKIDKNTVVCIIEAMKVMNEIKANITGTIVEVMVESGQPVEFGTKLFRIIE